MSRLFDVGSELLQLRVLRLGFLQDEGCQVGVFPEREEILISHPGVVVNEPIGALAHLRIGSAYATEGDTAKARAAYTYFAH